MRRFTATPALLLACSLAACATAPGSAPATAAADSTTTTAATPAPAADTESLTIAFHTGGAGLAPEAIKQLDTAARLYRDAKPEVMIISGHSDAVGAEYSNLLLSAKRADIVKRALVQRGIPADRLQIVAIGSAQPTPGVEPSRSAVVTWR